MTTATSVAASSLSSSSFLNLKEILQLFNCAISQEQAWAVLYQVLNEFKSLLSITTTSLTNEQVNNLELLKLNQDNIDLSLLNFDKDGSIHFGFKHKLKASKITNSANWSSSNLEQEKNALEIKILKSVAYLIYDALDYGNNFSNEPVLETSLSNLLLLTSGHYKEFSKNKASEDDEGYDQEEEDSVNLDKAIEICTNNVAIEEADYHYKAVCRGLYAQAYELKVFLAKIEDSKNILQKTGKDTTHYCFEVLDKTDWAKLWMQVIHELRNGVKLRKVSEQQQSFRRNIEYELTPFEILLDQIRARRYHLKKVSIENKLGAAIKKDARDIILEFIRSRPPLKKSSLRNISFKKKLDEPPNKHEQLMNSIRNYSTPLRKVSLQNQEETTNNDSTSSVNNKKKRLLKPDKKLLNNLTSSDDDDSDIDYEELKSLSILPEEYTSLNESTISSFYFNGSFRHKRINDSLQQQRQNNSNKRRIKPPESLKSPLAPWIDPVENWRALVTEDVVSGGLTPHGKTQSSNVPVRRHTMNIVDVQSMSSNLASLNIFAGLGTRMSEVVASATNGSTSSRTRMERKKLTENSSHGNQSLKLTFEELCHIRSVLTKAELDYLLFDNQLFQDVSRGKVCFSCRKTRFHLFNWGCKCRICQQRVCKKCLRIAQLKNGLVAQVPLSKLCPSKYNSSNLENDSNDEYLEAEDVEHDDNIKHHEVSAHRHHHHLHHRHESKTNQSHHSNSSMSSQATNDDDSSTNASDLVELTQKYLISINNTSQTSDKQLLDICVDCYQMMDGVSVSMSPSQHKNRAQKSKLKLNDEDEDEMSNGNDNLLLESIYLNGLKSLKAKKDQDETLFDSASGESTKEDEEVITSNCTSPEMSSLSNINSVSMIKTTTPPPTASTKFHLNTNKLMLSTKKNENMTSLNICLNNTYDDEDEDVDVDVEEDMDEYDNSPTNEQDTSKARRSHLTLDLEPVYKVY